MTNLKDINFGLNQYCGPSVLSALTGESTDRCAAVISSISGKKEIRAVEWHHLTQAFEKLRFNVTKVEHGRTLYGTLLMLADNDGFYIIGVPKHVVAIEVTNNQIYLIDNHSKSPLPADSSARLMQKVDAAYKVTPKDPPVFLGASIRLDRSVNGSNNRIDIYSVNRYKNPEDDNQFKLGSFVYKDDLELHQIIEEFEKL